MIRSELLQALHQDNPELRAEEIEQVVDIFFDEISDRLAEGGRVELRAGGDRAYFEDGVSRAFDAEGGRVELRGFGAFSTREREARVGRNPRTGEAVEVPAKRVPYFKAGKDMRKRLNDE